MAQITVADLSIDEFKNIIHEAIEGALYEFFIDPDKPMELRKEIVVRHEKSFKTTKIGVNTKPAKEVAAELGLKW